MDKEHMTNGHRQMDDGLLSQEQLEHAAGGMIEHDMVVGRAADRHLRRDEGDRSRSPLGVEDLEGRSHALECGKVVGARMRSARWGAPRSGGRHRRVPFEATTADAVGKVVGGPAQRGEAPAGASIKTRAKPSGR